MIYSVASGERATKVIEKFERVSGRFRKLIGAIDDTHIKTIG